MTGTLSPEQRTRVLACDAAHGPAIEAALTEHPTSANRMVSRAGLGKAVREAGRPLEVLIAWMHRLVTDDTVRPLDADLDVRWPREPDPSDAALVVRLAVDPACWYYEIRAALLLAERVVQKGPPREELVTALLELRSRLTEDRLHSSEFFRSKALPWLLRIVAHTTPPDLPDLAFLDPHDRWGPLVTDAVQAYSDPAGTARALLHLASPRGSKASGAWWAETGRLLDGRPGLVGFVSELLAAVTTVETTPRDDARDGWDVPDPFLLTPANELLARGMAWALRLHGPHGEVFDVLGHVALRSAAMVWVVPTHRMLCPKLAAAAVDSLLAIDSPAARSQLASIVTDIRAPALIRRIGPHVGLDPARVDAMVADLRKRGPLPRPDR